MALRGPTLRIWTQAAFLVAFGMLFFGLDDQRVLGEAASLLLALDPLTAVGTALADWTIPRWACLGLVVLAATAVAGRFFCGWICPLGTLQQLMSWLGGPEARRREQRNRYRPWFAIKYLVLLVLLVWAVMGAEHLGWLDPIPLMHRAAAAGLRPLWHGGASPGGWLSFGLLVAILLLSVWMTRFFCRAVCPLGALLGLFARWAPLRIQQKQDACSGCLDCLPHCQGADEPLGEYRVSECHVCLNCTAACSDGLLRYGTAQQQPPAPVPALDVSRRRFVLAAASAAAALPVLRVSGGGLDARRHDAIRPPGALNETAFLARCITCGACIAACPPGALITDLGRTGIQGLFTPVLVPRRGWCEPSCTRCGEVCPTGALARLAPATKQAIGAPAEVRIGTAFVDRGRCLPWAMETPCIVCEEMCPTSPKAIRIVEVRVMRNGGTITLQQPHIDPEMCTGCGLCENRCPVGELAAIRVSSVGETRDRSNSMLRRAGSV